MNAPSRQSFGFGVFRGLEVLAGIAMALIGFLLQEWSSHGMDFGPFLFFGGLLLGMGIVRNRQQQEAS